MIRTASARFLDRRLFHDVALKLRSSEPIEPGTLCHVYAEVALRDHSPANIEGMLTRHASIYLQSGYEEAYLAVELARGTRAHEKHGLFEQGRQIVLQAQGRASSVHPEIQRRIDVFVADTWWAERNAAMASAIYESVRVNPDWSDVYSNHVRIRAVDSLSAAGKADRAIQYVVNVLRHSHRNIELTHAAVLRAKAIFLLVSCERIAEALPFLIGLRRIARGSDDDRLKWLYTFFCAWTITKSPALDVLTPRPQMTIEDCKLFQQALE